MELGLPIRFIIAFIVVLALIMLTAWLIRRFSGGRVLHGGWVRGRDHRIEVLDAAPVDAKRRLVLVRRDHVEHLVMIGGSNDFVVENGIAPPPDVAAARAAAHHESVEKAAAKKKPEVKAEPTPEPAVAAPRAPAPVAPQPQPRPVAPVAKSAAVRTPPPPPTSAPAAATPPEPAPAKTAAEPAQPAAKAANPDPGFDDMAKRLEAALKPLDAPRPAPAASAPKPANPSADKPTGE